MGLKFWLNYIYGTIQKFQLKLSPQKSFPKTQEYSKETHCSFRSTCNIIITFNRFEIKISTFCMFLSYLISPQSRPTIIATIFFLRLGHNLVFKCRTSIHTLIIPYFRGVKNVFPSCEYVFWFFHKGIIIF